MVGCLVVVEVFDWVGTVVVVDNRVLFQSIYSTLTAYHNCLLMTGGWFLVACLKVVVVLEMGGRW